MRLLEWMSGRVRDALVDPYSVGWGHAGLAGGAQTGNQAFVHDEGKQQQPPSLPALSRCLSLSPLNLSRSYAHTK